MADLSADRMEIVLQEYGSRVQESNWQVLAGNSTTEFTVTLVNPTGVVPHPLDPSKYAGADIIWVSGQNAGLSGGTDGQIRCTISSVAVTGTNPPTTTVTVTQALPYQPAKGDRFVILVSIDVTVNAPENVKEWAGVDVAAPQGDADGVSPSSSGLPVFIAHLVGWTGSLWNRLFVDSSGRPNMNIDNATVQVPTDIQSSDQVLMDSTTSPLAASDSYTGNTVATNSWRRITGTCYSDQAGTLYVDQSPDGANWDFSSPFTINAGSPGIGISVEIVAAYARLRIANGATAQTTLRSYTYMTPVS